jgi:hypothetical protein
MRHPSLFWFVLVAVLAAVLPAQGQVTQEGKLVGVGNHDFGTQVALFLDRAAVNKITNQGDQSVYVFRYTGTNWVQEQKLNSPSGLSSTDFGLSGRFSGSADVICARVSA